MLTKISNKFKNYFAQHILWLFANCLWTDNLLCTAGMCDVTVIEIYKFYLHDSCFLFRLYKDMSCLTISHSTRLLCLSIQVHTFMPLFIRSSSLRIDGRQTSWRNKAYFEFAFERIHATPLLLFLGMSMLWKLYFLSTELGGKLTRSSPWNATSCHIFYANG